MLSNLTCDLLQNLERAENLRHLWLNTSKYLESFGLTHFVYSFVDPTKPANTCVWTSLPKYWNDRYMDQEYYLQDPFYSYCCKTFLTFLTGPSFLDRYTFLNEAERRIILEGGQTGFNSGFSAPVRLFGRGAFGGWNFGSSMEAAEMEQLIKSHGAEIRFASFCIHEHVAEADKCRSRLYKHWVSVASRARMSALVEPRVSNIRYCAPTRNCGGNCRFAFPGCT